MKNPEMSLERFKNGMKFVLKVERLQNEGHYKEAILEMHHHVENMSLTRAAKIIKWGRVTKKHKHAIAGGKGYCYPWCTCGWHGEHIYGDDSFDKAEKIKCPNLLASLKAYNLTEILEDLED